MAEQNLLTNLVQGKQKKNARFEALLVVISELSFDIKNLHAPDAATLREDKVLKNNSTKPFIVPHDVEIMNMRAITSDTDGN